MPWRFILQSHLIAALALGSTRAIARMGGGESYDSGSSSSGGDGDGLGFIIDILWWLILEEPKVGIPLTIAVIIIYLVFNKLNNGDISTRKAIDRAEARARTQPPARAVENGLAALKARDPQFDAAQFHERTRREFLEMQEAWFKRDLEPVRRYLSDATFQRLSTQLLLMQALGVRDAIADPEVIDIQIIRIEARDSFDTLHARITARIHDDEVAAGASDSEARASARSKWPEQFTEVWTFVRRPSARTRPDIDISQGQCPGCGAPFAGGAANTCEYCGAIVNSGTHDWVLAEITQGSQYQPNPREPQDFANIRRSDPALASEVLEDRASLLFWKWIEAYASGDASRLAKVASPAFVDRTRAEIGEINAQGKRKYFIDCAVGAVNTQQFRQADGRDIAVIEIRWSAKIAIAPRDSHPTAPSQPQRHVMLLERRSGAKTGTTGMSTGRCPSCAAPLSDNGQPDCEFCGTVLAAGDADWVLRDFGSWEWWRAQGESSTPQHTSSAAPDVPDREERERLVYLMAAMANADGVVEPKERGLLRMASERWNVPWENIEQALDAPADPANRPVAKGSPEAIAFFRDLVRLARADNRIDAKEKKLLKATAMHLGLMDRFAEFTR